jgi:arylsulfatase A-like enzyme
MNENPERSSNVIMVLLDALRPDHLSAYGYEKKTSPNIDELSKDGIIFKNAFTQSTFTREAVASLLSALYPLTHNVGYVNKMSDEIIALPEVMKLFNYKTVAFTSNGFINKDCGILQGFDEIYELFRKEFWGPHNSTPGESFIPYIDDWLFNKYKDKYFLFLHFMQPHEPYKAPQSFKIFSSDDPKSVLDGSTYNRNKVKERGIPITSNDVMHMKHLYDDNIYYIDYVVGKLLHKLKLLDLYDNTMVILLSDHGEEFMEHGGFSHSMHLYDECLHFTLIIKMPQNMYKGKEIKSLVQLIDIPNTILEAVGINKTIGQGKSLMPLLKEHSNTEVHNAIFASRKSFIGLRTHRYKYIENINSNGVELYDLLTDPLEQVNIVDKNPEIAKQMSELLKGWRQNQKAYVPKGSEEIDEQTKEILRSLGYLR